MLASLLKAGTLIDQLTKVIKAVEPIVSKLWESAKTGRDVRETLDLHASTLESVQKQLKLVESILEAMQRSLKVFIVAIVALAVIAFTALFFALVK